MVDSNNQSGGGQPPTQNVGPMREAYTSPSDQQPQGGAASGVFNNQAQTAPTAASSPMAPVGPQVTFGPSVTTGGRRPRRHMYEIPARTAQRFQEYSNQVGQSAERINELSQQQAAEMQRGVDDLRERRAEAEADLDERRQGIERSVGDYRAAISQLDQASELDPGRVWARADTPTRIMASIAMGGQAFANVMAGNVLDPSRRLGPIGQLGGAMQRLQQVISRDLELQENEYNRARHRAAARRDIYGMMRERFQDETTAHNMAEAAAYQMVQRQAQVFGNQIQNERTRIQLGQLGAQAGQAADQALQRALQARDRERARSRGGRRVPMTTTMPDGTQVTTMLSQRDFNRHMLGQHNESMESARTLQRALAQAQASGDPQAQRAAYSAINRFGSSLIPSLNNVQRTQESFGALVQQATEAFRQEHGRLPDGIESLEIAGANPVRALLGSGRLRDFFAGYFEGNPAGERFRQQLGQDLFNAIKQQSGAQFTDKEFERRMQIALGSMQTPEQILTGIQILGEMASGGAQTIRGLSPGAYRRFLSNNNITGDPLERVQGNQRSLNSLLGGSYSTNTAGNVVGLLDDLGVFEDDSDARGALYGALNSTERTLGNAYGGIEIGD